MIKDARSRGLGMEAVDSVYLQGEQALLEHERRNGYDKAWGPHGVQRSMSDQVNFIPKTSHHVVLERDFSSGDDSINEDDVA